MYLGVQDAPGAPGSLQRVQALCATGAARAVHAAMQQGGPVAHWTPIRSSLSSTRVSPVVCQQTRPGGAEVPCFPPLPHRPSPAVVEAFSQAGLLLPQDERAVKLHATVLNTRYRRRGSSGDGQQQGQQQGREARQPFDGRGLLARHGGVDLGGVPLPAVHLSQRGQYNPATGFYRCFDSLPLS